MNLLLVHQNYPGQYRELLPRLVAGRAHSVVFLTQRKQVPKSDTHAIAVYKPDQQGTLSDHPYVNWYESCVRNGIGAMRAGHELARRGFRPDLIVGHAGWGELMLLKEVWPDVPVIGYFEYYFIAQGGLIGYDPEFPEPADIAARLHARNATNYVSYMRLDDGYTASEWQRRTYPSLFHDKIQVLHEGIRTDRLKPDHSGREPLTLAGHTFGRDDELVTYIARNLEPARGFHTMMRALPELQRLRPAARLAVVGADSVSYGRKLADGKTFRGLLMKELEGKVDWSRVHFLGEVPYGALMRLLQLARCHVYLTVPFVVSWSFLEAMALEKTIVASDVAPVRQFATHGETALLVDFFRPDQLAGQIAEVLGHPDHYRAIGEAARRHVVAHYDFDTVGLPAFLRLANRWLPAGKRITL